MKEKLYHDALPYLSINPASIGAGAKTGDAIIDTQGYEEALVIVASGALTVDMPFQLMHGDESDLSDAAAVPDADLVGSEPTLLEATDNEIASFSYVGTKRYLRVDTTTGTGLAVALILLSKPRHAPVQ
jgi:hypothetical protein